MGGDRQVNGDTNIFKTLYRAEKIGGKANQDLRKKKGAGNCNWLGKGRETGMKTQYLMGSGEKL